MYENEKKSVFEKKGFGITASILAVAGLATSVVLGVKLAKSNAPAKPEEKKAE